MFISSIKCCEFLQEEITAEYGDETVVIKCGREKTAEVSKMSLNRIAAKKGWLNGEAIDAFIQCIIAESVSKLQF